MFGIVTFRYSRAISLARARARIEHSQTSTEFRFSTARLHIITHTTMAAIKHRPTYGCNVVTADGSAALSIINTRTTIDVCTNDTRGKYTGTRRIDRIKNIEKRL